MAGIVVVVALGLFLRIWLLGREPLTEASAIVGVMAHGVLHRHFFTFYWGQNYGGAEPYVVAAVLRAINGGPMGLNATPVALAAVAALLVYAVLATSGVPRRMAALGAAMTWVWPYTATWNSVREIGFRGATLVCGLVLVLCALRVFDHSAGPTGSAHRAGRELGGRCDCWAHPLRDHVPHTGALGGEGGLEPSSSPLDDQRSSALAHTVARDDRPAWLFFAPGPETAAANASSNPDPGPGGYSQGAFTAYLTAHRVGYRIVHLGVLDAVIPQHRIRHLPPLG